MGDFCGIISSISCSGHSFEYVTPTQLVPQTTWPLCQVSLERVSTTNQGQNGFFFSTDSRISKPKEGLHSQGSNFFGPAMNLLRETWKDLIWLYVPARSSTLKKIQGVYGHTTPNLHPFIRFVWKLVSAFEFKKKKKKSQAEQSWNFEVYQIWTYLLNKSKF